MLAGNSQELLSTGAGQRLVVKARWACVFLLEFWKLVAEPDLEECERPRGSRRWALTVLQVAFLVQRRKHVVVL